LGHIKRNCYKQGGGKEDQGQSVRPEKDDRKRKESEHAMSAWEPRTFDLAFAAYEYQRPVIGSQDAWVVDSGCTAHMCKNKSLFSNVKRVNQRIWLADGQVAKVEGIGQVKVGMMDKNGVRRIATLLDVLYIPKLGYNLFSVRKATDMGHSVLFGRKKSVIKTKDGLEIPLSMQGYLYILPHLVQNVHEECATDTDDDDDHDEHWKVPVKVETPVKSTPVKLETADTGNDHEFSTPVKLETDDKDNEFGTPVKLETFESVPKNDVRDEKMNSVKKNSNSDEKPWCSEATWMQRRLKDLHLLNVLLCLCVFCIC
jgi:hypothetical protein